MLRFLLGTCGVRAESLRACVSVHECFHVSACVCMDLRGGEEHAFMCVEAFCPPAHEITMLELK